MKMTLGVKTDPIEHRYSHEWLFDLMAGAGAGQVQFGSFFEMYFLEPEWFVRLRERAEERMLRIKSLFTSHRELGGIMTGDPAQERVAMDNYRRLLDIAVALGVDFVGSNLGAVYYDRMDYKPEGLRCAVAHLKEMSHLAWEKKLRGLTIEPMSCLAEPPSTPDECDWIMRELADYHLAHPDTVPVYFCGDISHGYADAEGKVVNDNWSCFRGQIPHMCEFHFKNTDAIFHSTFGFGPEECRRGIVGLDKFRTLIEDSADSFPIEDVTGYLEINHIKQGRDYTDKKLGAEIMASLEALLKHFNFVS